VDFDGDGILDVLSGSWPGELYFFRGLGKGQFEAGVTIKNKSGKPIKVDNASTVFAADWNGDGLLDLLVGSIEGYSYLILNEGSRRKHAFGAPTKLIAAGKPIKAGMGDSQPVAADWDGDGLLDLLLGAGDGSVHWFRNAGTRTEPKLAAAQALLPASKLAADYGPGRGIQRGMRSKICVADWNGDGVPDLMVGEFSMTAGPARKLTDAQKSAYRRAQDRTKKADAALQPFMAEMRNIGSPSNDSASRAAWQKKYERLSKRFQKQMEESSAAYQVQRRYEADEIMNGFVWVAIAQSPAVARH
jgi:hypothetical protein